MVNDAWHECLTPEDAAPTLDRRSARAWRSGAVGLPSRRGAHSAKVKTWIRSSSKHVREPNSFTLDFYLQHDGYAALKSALDQEARRDHRDGQGVRAARPRRRRASRPGMKWQFVDKKAEPRYIACNADESEPGTFKDHLLMERNPHLLIEGCAIGCYAIGAKVAYIYIRGEFLHVQHVLEQAIDGRLRAAASSAGTSSGRASTATSTCTAAPAPTRRARRRRCSNRSKASARSRATSRRSRPWSALRQADRRQQRRDAVQRAADRRERRRVVRGARSGEERRPEAVLRQRPREAVRASTKRR